MPAPLQQPLPSQVPVEFQSCWDHVFKPSGLTVSKFFIEPEARQYAGCTLELNQVPAVFRAAKTTPSKAGQFLTLWQRSAEGPIRPFGEAAHYELFIVQVHDEGHQGVFIFSAATLQKAGILSTPGSESTPGREGKRAFRIYPPWCQDLNRQAQRSQTEHYLDLPLSEEALDSIGTLFEGITERSSQTTIARPDNG